MLSGGVVCLVGFSIHCMGALGILTYNFYTHNIIKLTTVIEFLLLSFAVRKKALTTLENHHKYKTAADEIHILAHDILRPTEKMRVFVERVLSLTGQEQQAKFIADTGIEIRGDIDMTQRMVHTVLDKRNTIPAKSSCKLKSILANHYPEFNFLIDCNRPIKINEDTLKRIIWNITKNALEATQKEGHHNCTFSISSKQVGDIIKIDIFNTGSYIDKKDLPQVLSMNFTKKKNGSGIGLSSVAKHVIQYNGFLQVESNGYIYFYPEDRLETTPKKELKVNYVKFSIFLPLVNEGE